MNTITRRIAATLTMAAAAAMIGLGAASAAQADITIGNHGPSITQSHGRSAHSSQHHRDNRPIHQNAMTGSAAAE